MWSSKLALLTQLAIYVDDVALRLSDTVTRLLIMATKRQLALRQWRVARFLGTSGIRVFVANVHGG